MIQSLRNPQSTHILMDAPRGSEAGVGELTRRRTRRP